MKVLDPGHRYALQIVDGEGDMLLQFVKREGEGYPGNVGSYAGTNIQEVLRAAFNRLKYLDRQIEDGRNEQAWNHIAQAIWLLECRAADRHGRARPTVIQAVANETCKKCGHVGCAGGCHLEIEQAVAKDAANTEVVRNG